MPPGEGGKAANIRILSPALAVLTLALLASGQAGVVCPVLLFINRRHEQLMISATKITINPAMDLTKDGLKSPILCEVYGLAIVGIYFPLLIEEVHLMCAIVVLLLMKSLLNADEFQHLKECELIH
ncbi:hypothetical protein HUJ04_008461 [Dendroctonus ponderosae]|nr:hypothetical protein HUJ04_008461 [Dendroctonus ponderosae]